MKKKVYYLMTIFLFTLNSFAQEEQRAGKPPKFEIGFNALKLSIGEGIYLSSDYLLNESSSIGLVSGFQDDKLNKGLNELKIGANYKHYFSKKYTQGFYASSGFSYNYAKHNYYDFHTYQPISDDFYETKSLNFDFDLGYKLVSKKGLSLDAFIGFSQPLFSNRDRREFKVNYGIKLSKRF
jgi:hypothetical protein